MKHFLVAIILLPFISFCQGRRSTDSSSYYRKKMEKDWKVLSDSFRKSESYANYVHYNQRKNNYNGVVLFGNMVNSNYGAFNKSIASQGFPALNPLSFGLGFGFSGKREHVITDFYFGVANFENTSKNGDEKIGSSLGNVFQLDIGYNVLSSPTLSIYPFAGLSLRIASMSYERTGTINPAYTNISNIFTNDVLTYTSSVRLGYQAGLGIEVHIADNKTKTAPILIFAKAGINKPFVRDNYKIKGVKYDPDISKGDLNVALGFKFAGRY